MSAIGIENIEAHERELTVYALEQLRNVDGIHIYGHDTAALPAGQDDQAPGEAVISFNVGGIHHMDMGTLLDQLGIAVRTGHHCAQPLMDRLGVLGTVRASFSVYNTRAEVDALVAGIRRVVTMF